MRQPLPATWIVVMDSSRACFWKLHYDGDNHRRLDEVAPPMESSLHQHSGDVLTDAPGRYNRGAGQLQQNTFEVPHDPHKQEKHDFVQDVVERLKQAHNAHEFERLAIVAPERTIGEFRASIHNGLKKALWLEIGKDLVKLQRDALWEHIAPELIDHPAS